MTDFRDPPDVRSAKIAAGQHGVITVRQLREVGLDADAVRLRVRAGRLHRLHRGVYSVGHRALSWRGRWAAAVFAGGEGAALSHQSAAELWGFLRPGGMPIDISVPGRSGRKRHRGITTHRPRRFTGRDVTRTHGIAVTTPARTIADIRTTVAPYLFRRALRQAELAGYRVPHLAVTQRTRSDLELLFLALCDDHGLPRPLVNHRVHGHLVDFFFADHYLVVETDSRQYHRGSVSIEDDHARDLALRAHGIEVRRYTGDQLDGSPDAVVADLKEALGCAS